MIYGEQDAKISGKLDTVRVIKWEDCGGWETSLECEDWILAESLLFLK
jgi:hypothetical protein